MLLYVTFNITTVISQYHNSSYNPFPNKPWVLHVCNTSLLKILWEKEKLLVTSNFSLKELADDNFKLDENSRKFSKWAENTVGKGEIARYKQFLLLQWCFQKTCSADT